MVDPGFPRWGYQPLILGQNLVFDKIFDENFMKVKEIGPRVGVCAPSALSWIRVSDFSSGRLFVCLCSYLSLDTATVTVAHKLNPLVEPDEKPEKCP